MKSGDETLSRQIRILNCAGDELKGIRESLLKVGVQLLINRTMKNQGCRNHMNHTGVVQLLFRSLMVSALKQGLHTVM